MIKSKQKMTGIYYTVILKINMKQIKNSCKLNYMKSIPQGRMEPHDAECVGVAPQYPLIN
jgi:hypothetical protein